MEDESLDWEFDEEDVMIDEICHNIENKYRNLLVY